MKRKVGAILLDTRSIQKYVFGCNELKTNVGASYIVDRIFNDLMCNKVLPAIFKNTDEEKIEWKENDQLEILTDDNIKCEIVYIGGGNMLLLVRLADEEATLAKCREIVSLWTKNILLSAPGLKTGAAIGFIDISTEKFKSSLDELYKQLKINQNNIVPIVDLPYTGITKECDVSGKTADAYDYSKNCKRMIASEVKAKIQAYEFAREELEQEYEKILQGKYVFAEEFEKIGYRAGESYLSIIHIDGNNMGVKFSACTSVQERKELSKHVQENVKAAFRKLLQSIVDEYESYNKYLALETDKNGKKILPIRPIIIGGDDVTFVCPGRLGLEYAKRFIEEMNDLDLLTDEQHEKMEKELNKNIVDKKDQKVLNKRLSCCAGIAIVPTKYPFFRAYELAEQLCSAAKKKSRQDDTSWLDFAVLHGEKTPELAQLRRQQYIGSEGELHFGPYRVEKDYNAADGINALFRLSDRLGNEEGSENNWHKLNEARSKIKKLREVLTGDQHSINILFENAKVLRKVVETETSDVNATAKSFWEYKDVDGKQIKATRYIDAIEIMEFRPQ